MFASIHQDEAFLRILPLGLLYEGQGVAVCDGEVLAEDLDVVDRLLQVVVNVLLDRDDCLVVVGVLQRLGQLLHAQVHVLILEGKQLKLKVDLTVSLGLPVGGGASRLV